ncbi:MAG TPA: hypothetical protein PLJ60_02695 [Chryseolinea sp.]|nr:hypothetical protein [Chryseolinea sp.]
MNCKKAHRQIHLFTELTSEEYDQLLNHINECEACMELAESMKLMTNIVNRISQVEIKPLNSAQLTGDIMSGISKSEFQTFNVLNWILSYLDLRQVRFTMATVSAMLIILLVVEQSKPTQFQSQYSSQVTTHSLKTTILDTQNFQHQLQNYKATEKFKLLNSCRNPFNESRYTAACLREKNERFKTI